MCIYGTYSVKRTPPLNRQSSIPYWCPLIGDSTVFIEIRKKKIEMFLVHRLTPECESSLMTLESIELLLRQEFI